VSNVATNPVQPVWWAAPRPAPLSPWKHSWKRGRPAAVGAAPKETTLRFARLIGNAEILAAHANLIRYLVDSGEGTDVIRGRELILVQQVA
jgi:hypothetical protein